MTRSRKFRAMFHLSYLEVTSVVMSKHRTDMVTTLASLLDCTPALMAMANWTERTAPFSFHIVYTMQADGPREWDKRITHVEKHIWKALVDAEDTPCSVVALYWRREFPLLLHVGPTHRPLDEAKTISVVRYASNKPITNARKQAEAAVNARKVDLKDGELFWFDSYRQSIRPFVEGRAEWDDSILWKRKKPYSRISMRDIPESSFRWAPIGGVHHTTSDMIARLVANAEGQWTPVTDSLDTSNAAFSEELLQQIDAAAAYITPALQHLQATFMPVVCFAEATRRLIINPFVIASTAIVQGQLDVKHHFNAPAYRLGNGPVDYDFATNVVLHNIGNQEDNIADTDDPAETQHAATGYVGGILNASQPFIYVCGLGQLLAQLLDKLSAIKASCPSPSTRVDIKGILSTGQWTMFFMLVQEPEATCPTLHYYGRWGLDILPRHYGSTLSGVPERAPAPQGATSAGTRVKLEAEEIVQRGQVEALLRAYVAFLLL